MEANGLMISIKCHSGYRSIFQIISSLSECSILDVQYGRLWRLCSHHLTGTPTTGPTWAYFFNTYIHLCSLSEDRRLTRREAESERFLLTGLSISVSLSSTPWSLTKLRRAPLGGRIFARNHSAHTWQGHAHTLSLLLCQTHTPLEASI